MNRMFLIKTNAKHSIPNLHLFMFLHWLHFHTSKNWLIDQTATFFFPHLTGQTWKPCTHIAQQNVVQQNQWPVKMCTQAAETLWLWELDLPFPPKGVQSYVKFQHWAGTAQYCPELTTALNAMLEQSIEKEN